MVLCLWKRSMCNFTAMDGLGAGFYARGLLELKSRTIRDCWGAVLLDVSYHMTIE